MNFKALDANDQLVQTEGMVTVTAITGGKFGLPDGREVKGDELKSLPRKIGSGCRPDRPNQKDGDLKFRGYEHDDISRRRWKTDTKGTGGR